MGKVTVPPAILNKRGKPNDAEWAILQNHPAAGAELVAPVAEWLGEWVHAVGGHHERWDGTGYPLRLAGHEIPRAAAMVAVADSFEVMTAVRSYKSAMSLAERGRADALFGHPLQPRHGAGIPQHLAAKAAARPARSLRWPTCRSSETR